MAFDLSRYSFSHHWFLGSGLHRCLLNHIDPNQEHHVLEIGNFEGMSACWLSDTVLEHPASSLTCVDPFDVTDPCTPVMESTEDRFHSNISKSRNFAKCSIHKAYSDVFFEKNKEDFDIIYIDGSHIPDQITRDMEHSFGVLQPGGIMWMDDYQGGDGSIKRTMDAFLQKHAGEYKLLFMEYQLAIQKLGGLS